jgi:hypothetical protein
MPHWSNEEVKIEFPPGVTDKKKVWRWLREIVQMAHEAEPPAPNADLIIYLAFKCCADDHNGPVTDHKDKLTAAYIAARGGQWNVVTYELDHDV